MSRFRLRRRRLHVTAVGSVVAMALSAATYLSADATSAPARTRTRVDVSRLSLIRARVEEEIAARHLPGAVVLVGTRSGAVYREAFGRRSIVPASEPMTVDTVFDLASLTKVVATVPAIMRLIEDGRVRLDDPVATYIPEFARFGKDRITVRQLLTHTSGLRPDLDLAVGFTSREEAFRLAHDEVPIAPPGARMIYSDINFIVLGELVEIVSGQSLDAFVASEIFGPAGMRETGFRPPAAMFPRIAPTERCRPTDVTCPEASSRPIMLRGVVHDPTARAMGGVAGHAGVFSTASDLSRFCRMLLGGGTVAGHRVLSQLSVRLMTTAVRVSDGAERRGLGWDSDSRFSSNRGDLFPVGTFGHTGFTGTSLWIDPLTGVYVVFLSNRVHPDGEGDVTALRGRIASIVASAIVSPRVPARTRMLGHDFGVRPSVPRRPPTRTVVMNGIDVLRTRAFDVLEGRSVGLLTNHTGRAGDGISTIDVLSSAHVRVVALFSPEHGIRGVVDESVPSTRDAATGLPIYSLYGETRRPTDAMLQGIDTIVIDLQDVGVRFYTYASTMGYVMEEAARRGIRVVVLDRPNPLNGFTIEGPLPEDEALGFTAYYPLPTRHGLTLGELARLFNGERHLGADLVVVPMRNWSRDQWFDETGLEWINPSPNMRSLTAAALYPGIGSIEFANISVGRGTDAPFEQIGAPWIDAVQLAAALNDRQLAGVRFYPVTFTPTSSQYAGQPCHGVRIMVADRDALRPVRLGLEIASALFKLYPGRFDPGNTWRLLGSRAIVDRLKAGESPAAIANGWQADEARWRHLRAQYLLYY